MIMATMKPLPLALFTVLLVSPALFAETITATALAPATMDELVRVSVAVPGRQRAREHHERERTYDGRPANAAIVNIGAATMEISPQAVAAPPATRGFQALNDIYTSVYDSTFPADPSGAAGPHHVVGAFNNGITVHDRSGNLLSRVSNTHFWHDASLPDKYYFDPRVAYDAANDRWVTLILGDDFNYTNGVLFIAVSVSGDPTAGWRRFRVPVDPTGHLDGDISHLGITADKIVVTVKVWTGGSVSGGTPVNTTVFTMSKSAAFAGPNLPVTTNDLPQMDDLAPLSSDDTTVRLVEWRGTNTIRTFELLASGATANSRERTANASFGEGECAQLGSNAALRCCGILLSGVARNGTMWIAQEMCGAPLIWKIKGDAVTTYVIRDSPRSIGFPSIAVNRRGAALVGYVVMSSSIYLTAGYSYIDPAGNISAPAILKSGEATYNEDRWGDFTTTVVDPVDDLSFWALGNYAESGIKTRWATWWGYIPIHDGPPHQRAVRR